MPSGALRGNVWWSMGREFFGWMFNRKLFVIKPKTCQILALQHSKALRNQLFQIQTTLISFERLVNVP
jgi:hypothetical protein